MPAVRFNATLCNCHECTYLYNFWIALHNLFIISYYKEHYDRFYCNSHSNCVKLKLNTDSNP